MNLTRPLCCLFLGLLWTVPSSQAQDSPDSKSEPKKLLASVESPNHRIRAEFPQSEMLHFNLLVDGKKVGGTDLMELRLSDHTHLGEACLNQTVTARTIDETWHPVTGKTSTVRNQANEITIHDVSDYWYAFDLVVRAYDDGLAYRYVVSENNKPLTPRAPLTANEWNQFTFLGDPRCWYADYRTANSSQEANFTAGRMSDIHREAGVGMPVLLRVLPDLYVALTEADLTHWTGSRFKSLFNPPAGGYVHLPEPGVPSSDSEYRSLLMSPIAMIGDKGAKWPDPAKLDSGFIHLTLPAQSPWRVIMIGKTPGDLIQSNLIENLNPPSEIKDTSWIKPGIASWDWWSGRSEMKTDSIKKFIQLSADMGWPYMLLDAGWNYHNDQPDGDITRVTDSIDMPELLRFAKERNVRLWLWMSWRDVLRNDAYKKAFPMFRDWGIAGVKIDYMDREDQAMVDFYQTMFQATAENHLMLDLHGAYKPTGARRTWPNFITQEGVLGNEYNRSSRLDTARHNVTIPYTRGLLGPMDYTPGGFVNRTPAQFQPTDHGTTVPNTRGQELAKFVVFESPLQMACDHPDNYRDQPGADFLKVVKTSWDEVRWLGGEVGESIVLARRSGDEWFVGGMTNEDARKVDVKLDFLPKDKTYTTTIWRDAPDADVDATKLVREEKTVTAADVLPVSMAPAGGFVLRLVPAR